LSVVVAFVLATPTLRVGCRGHRSDHLAGVRIPPL